MDLRVDKAKLVPSPSPRRAKIDKAMKRASEEHCLANPKRRS